jgi:hypothetical protein
MPNVEIRMSKALSIERGVAVNWRRAGFSAQAGRLCHRWFLFVFCE